MIATAASNIITIRDVTVTTGEPPDPIHIVCNGQPGIVAGIAFNHDGSLLASAHTGGTAQIWDTKTGAYLRSLRGHTDELYDILFVPDSNDIITSGQDKTVRYWRCDPTKLLSFNQWMLLLGAYYAAQENKKYTISDHILGEEIERMPTCLQQLVRQHGTIAHAT